MNAKVDSGSSGADLVRLSISGLILAAGIYAFYHFSDYSQLVRVVGMVVVAGIAVAIALTSSQGQRTWAFFVAARTEVRKVVWPTRQETIQTTLIVFVMVFFIALVLWLFDSLLSFILRMLIG